MELFLNIFWFVIAIAGVILWRTRWTRQSRSRRHAEWREWTAFVCSMVLLFFVVSLTDDLHAELMLIEECSSSRRLAACPPHAPPPQNDATSHAWIILPSSANLPSFSFISSIIPVAESFPLRLSCDRASGRAPPIAVL